MGKLDFGTAKENYDKQQETSAKETITTETAKQGKKSNTDFIRLDLKPRGGQDLLAYCSKRCGDLGEIRGKRVTTTSFIQELILKDMEEQKAKKTLSAREAKIELIKSRLENLDDKQIAALETITSTM